jgi:hypothetical protein
MRLANIDAMTLDAIVREQVAVRGGKLFVVRQVVDRGRQTVAADTARDTARAMQGILQSRGKRLERFRMTEVNVFPVRVGEDRMKQHVIECLAIESNFE